MISLFKKFFVKETVNPFSLLVDTVKPSEPSRVQVLERQVADLAFKYTKTSTVLGRLLYSYMKQQGIQTVDQAILCLESGDEPDVNLQKSIIAQLEYVISPMGKDVFNE